MTVSLCMLVKDPPLDRLAALIELCRPTISEIVIVVDDRTDEATVEIMRSWENVTLVPFTWIDDFSAGRNAALSIAQGEWVLHLDPDEVPTEKMLAHIREVTSVPDQHHLGYLYMTENWWGGQKGSWQESDWHTRLFQRTHGTWYRPVHELVQLDGLPESATRNTEKLSKAPRDAWLIHSKPMDIINRDSALYARLSRGE